MVFTVTTITTEIRIVHIFIKIHCPTSVQKGFVGKILGLRNKDYVNAGFFNAWFLVPKKICFVINDYGVISDKRKFQRFSDELRMKKFGEFISLSEEKNRIWRIFN